MTIRSLMKGAASALLVALVACESRTDTGLAEESIGKSEGALYTHSDVPLWTQNGNAVPMCWYSTSYPNGVNGTNWDVEKQFIQDAIADSWQAVANISVAWAPCATSGTAKQVRINLHTSPDFTRGVTGGAAGDCLQPGSSPDSAGLGMNNATTPADAKWCMELGFPLDWNTTPEKRKRARYAVIHEFGHVLGFDHEQNRGDREDSPPCDEGSDLSAWGANRGVRIGPYDQLSVMNYCASNPDTLTAGDVAGVRSIYGVGAAARDWSFAYQDAWYGFGSSDVTKWRTADVNGDGRSDLVNITWSSTTGIRVHTMFSSGNGNWTTMWQDAWPGFGLGDVANWRVMDINADGRMDLVHVAWSASVIRVHSLISRGDGTWSRVYQDAWPGFGLSDVANWRAMDVNGDGRQDLVHLMWTSPGNIRVHTMFSSGNGTWTIAYHDAVTGFGASDVQSWKVTDVDGDGRKDLVYVLFTNPGLRVHTLRSLGNGAFAFDYQNAWPGFGASDVQSWQAADVNRDGKTDLVHVMWQSVDGGTIRVHTLFSDGFNRWGSVYHDAWSGFGASDVANWRVMDANGDGRMDLVHVLWSSPGNIRVHSLFSNGTGRWTPDFYDAVSGFGSADVANWRPARVDGDSATDLVHVWWRSPGTVRVHSLRSVWAMNR